MGFSFSVVLDVGAPVLRRPTRCSATRRLTTAARRRRINRASTSRSCTRTATSTTHWPTTATTTVGLRSTLRRPQVAAAATDWPAPTTTHGTMDSIRSTANNNNNSSSSSSNSSSNSSSSSSSRRLMKSVRCTDSTTRRCSRPIRRRPVPFRRNMKPATRWAGRRLRPPTPPSGDPTEESLCFRSIIT